MYTGLHRAEQMLVVIAIAGAALVVWPSQHATYGLPKGTFVSVVAVLAVVIGAARGLLQRRYEVPFAPVFFAMAGVVLVMSAATVLSPTPMLALMGSARQTGLVSYVASFLVATSLMRAFRGASTRPIVDAFLLAGALTALYGLVQTAGFQPLGFATSSMPVFATLGNANFLSGWLAIVAPIALGVALGATFSGHRGDPRYWRVAAGVLYVLVLYVCVGTRSFQGMAAASLGSMTVLLVWLTGGPARELRRRIRTSLRGRLGAVGIALVGVGVVLALSGSVVAQAQSGLAPRLNYWSAASRLAADHPVIGTGPDTFALYYQAYYRDVSGVPYEQADDPHSVPLAMLAAGGVPLLLAYLALVVATGTTLLSGLRRLGGAERLLLASFGGAWVAYQAQSAVSIDIPPLALSHWVLAAAIVTIAGAARFREVQVGQKRRRPSRGRRRGGRVDAEVPIAVRTALGVLVVLAVLTMMQLLRPMRAAMAADEAQDFLASGRADAALSAAGRATDLAPWQARNWYLRGAALERHGRISEARDAAKRAFALDPSEATYALIVAQLARRGQDHEEALSYFRKALAADPHDYAIVANASRGLILYGKRDEALPLILKTIRTSETAELWALAGRIYALDGDRHRAVEAYLRALSLDPGHREARAYIHPEGGG